VKKFVVGLVLIVLVLAGFFFFKPDKETEREEAPQVTAEAVARGSIRQVVETTGRIVSNLDVEIKCKASGEVITLPFDVSDPVKKGELLLELDPVDEERSVKQAEVQLTASRARLAQSEQNLKIVEERLKTDQKRAAADLKAAEAHAGDSQARSERLKTLLGKKLTSQEEYDSAQAAAIQSGAVLEKARITLEELKIQEMALEVERRDVELAETQVSLNGIALDQARQRLEDTKVVSPIDGVVVQRAVQTGQIISSGISNVGGGTTVMTISDLSRIFVLASVDESDIGAIRVGQRAMVTTDAYPDQRFMGKIVRVATRGQNVSNVVTFEVKIEVTGRNKSCLKPEMTANVELVVGESEDALLIPSAALFRRKKDRMVKVKATGGSVEERTVTVGITDGVNSEILTGLKEGEQIMVSEGGGDSRWRNDNSSRKMGRGMRMMVRGRRH